MAHNNTSCQRHGMTANDTGDQYLYIEDDCIVN